jgi:hypothetical protein
LSHFAGYYWVAVYLIVCWAAIIYAAHLVLDVVA